MHDVAAAARFREGLIAGDRFVRGAEGRVDLDRSHDGLSNGGLNFEEGANGDEKRRCEGRSSAVKSSP